MSGGKRPLIGVSTSEVRTPDRIKKIPEGEPAQREISLGMPYLDAVQQVGGVPVVVAPLRQDTITTVLDAVDALLLSGGPDLDPKTYGRAPHPELGPTEYAVDTFELALAREAYAREMPLLAICRGSQLLNVALGGTLNQHIPEQPGVELDHRQKQLGHLRTHEVEVVPGTLLAQTLGKTTVKVNSFHHQSVDELGKGLRVCAHSTDGVIEGIECVDRDYVLGVQWHAESLTDSADQESLFRCLAEAAIRYRSDAGTEADRGASAA